MVNKYPNRRSFLATFGTFSLLPAIAQAEEFIDLEWTDLLPSGQAAHSPQANNIIQHNQDSLLAQQPKSKGVRTDWNGQVVRLPGFIVPIEYSGDSVTAFILVPFLGACVHVPPPPANQLVFVTNIDHTLGRIYLCDVDPTEDRGEDLPVLHVFVLGLVDLVTDCR